MFRYIPSSLAKMAFSQLLPLPPEVSLSGVNPPPSTASPDCHDELLLFIQSLIISYFSFVLLQLFKISVWYFQAKQDSSLRFVHISKLQALIYIFVLSVSQVSRLREQNKLLSLPKRFLFIHLVIYCAISFIVKPSHLYHDVQQTFPLHFKRNLSTYFFIFIIFESIDNTALLCFQKKISTEPSTVSSDTFTSPFLLPPWYFTTSIAALNRKYFSLAGKMMFRPPVSSHLGFKCSCPNGHSWWCQFLGHDLTLST